MAFSFRKFSKKIFISINILVAIAFCAPCLQPWQTADTFWILGFFSLAFPYLFIILLVFIFFWLAAKPPLLLISLFAMVIAWKQVDVLFNVKSVGFTKAKKAAQLRIMSWNVQSFRGNENDRQVQKRNADKMFRLIEEMNPDILCLQEFGQYDSPEERRNYVKLLKSQGYDNFILSKDYSREKIGYSSGVPFFQNIHLYRL
jgi:hypothetical protein